MMVISLVCLGLTNDSVRFINASECYFFNLSISRILNAELSRSLSVFNEPIFTCFWFEFHSSIWP
jgi:hypothetical protein